MPGFQLLADADGVIAVLFALISIGAAIVNAVNGKKEPPRRNPNRPKDSTKVRREIEEFLDQQSGRKPRREDVIVEDIEVIEEPKPRPAPPRPAPKKKAQAPQRPKTTVQKPSSPPPKTNAPPAASSRPGERAVGNQNLGTSLREHVSHAMSERVVAQAERDLPHLKSRVNEEVQQDLGTFSVQGKPTASTPSKASPLVAMLRNPQSARDAVIIAEILGRPKALRR